MAKLGTELFESEWAILQVVWEREPCAAPTVQEVLREGKGWAYTTVKTMMDRTVRSSISCPVWSTARRRSGQSRLKPGLRTDPWPSFLLL